MATDIINNLPTQHGARLALHIMNHLYAGLGTLLRSIGTRLRGGAINMGEGRVNG